MLADDGAAADVEGRGEPAIDAEGFGSGGGADDVDDGVDCADLVEVDLFDGDGMDDGFGLAEKLEGAAGAGFYGVGERGGGDDLEDGGEVAVGGVCLGVWGLGVGGWGEFGGEDVDFGAGDAAADDFAGLEARADVESGGGLFKEGEGDASVDERAEEHVATDAGEAVEVCDSHCFVILNCGRVCRGKENHPSGAKARAFYWRYRHD